VNAAARALARSRGYALLGDLYSHGMSARTLPAWRQVPGVLTGPDAPIDLEAAAEAHARLFLIELPPYESAFCAQDGLLGGEITTAVRAARADAGLGDPLEVEPDHLGAELAWLAFLTGAEADARRDNVDMVHILELQRAALDHHILRWLPQFVTALSEFSGAGVGHGVDIYVRGAVLAQDLVLDHRAALGGPSPLWDLPPVVGVLDDPRTGLRGIAEHLCLPCQAGGYLTRTSITTISRSLDLPMTFGARSDLLEGLFCAAAQYDRIPDVCTALDHVFSAWDGGYAVSPCSLPWRRRVAITRAMLDRLAHARHPD
jgi:TorA maturation chaperone TorD